MVCVLNIPLKLVKARQRDSQNWNQNWNWNQIAFIFRTYAPHFTFSNHHPQNNWFIVIVAKNTCDKFECFVALDLPRMPKYMLDNIYILLGVSLNGFNSNSNWIYNSTWGWMNVFQGVDWMDKLPSSHNKVLPPCFFWNQKRLSCLPLFVLLLVTEPAPVRSRLLFTACFTPGINVKKSPRRRH